MSTESQARSDAVEHAEELITAYFVRDVPLTVEILNGMDSETRGLTAAAAAGIAVNMIKHLAHELHEDPLEVWQRLTQQAKERWMAGDEP